MTRRSFVFGGTLILIVGAVVAWVLIWGSNETGDSDNQSRPGATQISPHIRFNALAGHWTAHTSYLNIDSNGRAIESISNGCCDPMIEVTFQLSEPVGTSSKFAARLTVKSVTLHDWPSGEPAPTVGQHATIRLQNGVLIEPVTDAVYCKANDATNPACGP